MEYAEHWRQYGDTTVIPTRNFFYGIQPGDEISVHIEPGKTLIIRFLTTGEARDDGRRTVFFELNGQPRSVKVADRSKVAKRPPRRKAEADHRDHVGAPMPGTIATVNVTAGHVVARGDVLVTIEAMKMETSVRAERDGRVAEVVARPGEHVDAKDLLVVFEAGGGLGAAA
jgi:pyruvate carboxylase